MQYSKPHAKNEKKKQVCHFSRLALLRQNDLMRRVGIVESISEECELFYIPFAGFGRPMTCRVSSYQKALRDCVRADLGGSARGRLLRDELALFEVGEDMLSRSI